MELHRYLQVAFAKWYYIAILMLVAVAGTFAYVQWSATYKARTTVAVLELSVANPLGSQAAVVTFSDVVQSTIVAERVADALDGAVTPDEVQAAVDVGLSRSMVQNTTVPLYQITVKHKDKDLVLPLAEAVVKEAHAVFVEMNQLNPEEMLKSLEKLEQETRAQAAKARQDLVDFEQANNAFQLPRLIESRMSLVNALRLSGAQEEGSRAQVNEALNVIGARIAEARGQLDRFRTLKTEYSDLQFQLNLATQAVAQGEQRLRDLSLAGESGLRDAVAAQLASDRDRLARAQRSLQDFERTHRITNFDAEMASQLGLVTELERQQMALRTSTQTGAGRLQAEQEELARLQALQPEYERLSRSAIRALEQLDAVERRRMEWRLAATTPISNYVRPLDAPRLQSDLFLHIIFYTLAAVAGLVAGMLVVYVIAYFDRVPRTVEDVETLLGIPALGRVPQYRR